MQILALILHIITFKKAEVTEWIYKNKLVLHQDIKASIATIDAYDSAGLFAKNIRVHNILNHGKFKAEYDDLDKGLYERSKRIDE